jgi:hypothetical protein
LTTPSFLDLQLTKNKTKLKDKTLGKIIFISLPKKKRGGGTPTIKKKYT